MSITADTVAAAVVETFAAMDPAIPGAWMQREGGAFAAYCGIPVPNLNGVFLERSDADPAVVAELMNAISNSGVPHCLMLRPGCSPKLIDLAAQRGMTAVDPVPLMALDEPRALANAQHEVDCIVRRAAPSEAAVMAEISSVAFEMPRELLLQIIGPELLALPGVRAYIGETAGRPVATGVGVTAAGAVGIFNIATVPEGRGRGCGGAVTARAVVDGMGAGASFAWLQSSPLAVPLYQRLGFAYIEDWACFISGA
jgi:ribosomal protein S18 acetylase RimI-like enzyme